MNNMYVLDFLDILYYRLVKALETRKNKMFETPTLIFGIAGAIIAIVGCLVYVVRGGRENSVIRPIDHLSEDGPHRDWDATSVYYKAFDDD